MPNEELKGEDLEALCQRLDKMGMSDLADRLRGQESKPPKK